MQGGLVSLSLGGWMPRADTTPEGRRLASYRAIFFSSFFDFSWAACNRKLGLYSHRGRKAIYLDFFEKLPLYRKHFKEVHDITRELHPSIQPPILRLNRCAKLEFVWLARLNPGSLVLDSACNAHLSRWSKDDVSLTTSNKLECFLM